MKDHKDLIRYDFSKPMSLDAHSETYTVKLHCTNCGTTDDARLRKGIPQKGINFECENCGCQNTL